MCIQSFQYLEGLFCFFLTAGLALRKNQLFSAFPFLLKDLLSGPAHQTLLWPGSDTVMG